MLPKETGTANKNTKLIGTCLPDSTLLYEKMVAGRKKWLILHLFTPEYRFISKKI